MCASVSVSLNLWPYIYNLVVQTALNVCKSVMIGQPQETKANNRHPIGVHIAWLVLWCIHKCSPQHVHNVLSSIQSSSASSGLNPISPVCHLST